MDEKQRPEDPADSGEEPDGGSAQPDAEDEAEDEAAKEAEANLLAKIEMNVFGHP